MIVEGDHLLDGVEYTLACRIREAAKAAERIGLDVRITSGVRSYDEQAELYERWQRCERWRTGNLAERASYAALCGNVYPASRPGTSTHETGRAVDSVPVPTQEFAAWVDSGASWTVSTFAPGGNRVGVGPLNTGADSWVSTDSAIVQARAVAVWAAIRRDFGLWVPTNDIVHSEPCEYRR